MNIIKYMYIFIGLTAAIFVLLLLLSFITLIVRRLVKLKTLEKNIKSKNYRKKVTSIYRYYIRLLKFEKLDNSDQLPYLEFANRVAKESTSISAEQHVTSMQLFLKYRFSEQSLTKEELKYLENAVTEFSKNKKKALSGEDKFEFMFIENLG